MDRLRRRSMAAMLVVAFAGAPLLAAQCAAECEVASVATNETNATGATGAHAAGHAGHHPAQAPAAPLAIGQASTPCGHDHTRIVGVAPAGEAARAHVQAAAVAVLAPPTAWVAAIVLTTNGHQQSSPPGSALRFVSSPLRI